MSGVISQCGLMLAPEESTCCCSLIKRLPGAEFKLCGDSGLHIWTFEHLCRGELFASPQRSSQASSLGCNSLPNSQSEPSQQEALAAPRETPKDPPVEDGRGPPGPPEPPTPIRTDVRQRVSQQTFDNVITSSPSNKVSPLSFSRLGIWIRISSLKNNL